MENNKIMELKLEMEKLKKELSELDELYNKKFKMMEYIQSKIDNALKNISCITNKS